MVMEWINQIYRIGMEMSEASVLHSKIRVIFVKDTSMKVNAIEILPDWLLTYDEVSNGVFRFVATDKSGRKVGTTDTDFERGISTCKEYALDVEKSLRHN